MSKIIGVTELQRRFRVVFDEVAEHATPYVLTRDGKPEVVMVPYADWLRMQSSENAALAERIERILAHMEQVSEATTDEQVYTDVSAARTRARKKMRH